LGLVERKPFEWNRRTKEGRLRKSGEGKGKIKKSPSRKFLRVPDDSRLERYERKKVM